MTDILFSPIRISELETLIQNSVTKALIENQISAKSVNAEPDRWFDLTELCNYLPDKPAKPTIYGWVHSGLIPCHKGAKKLRFLKSEIDQWLRTGKQKTVVELASEASQYIKCKKG